MTMEIRNPIAPRTRIPIAEIFVTDWNSFIDGFFMTIAILAIMLSENAMYVFYEIITINYDKTLTS